MQVSLAYGQGLLEVEVPESALVIEPTFLNGLSNEEAAVKNALRNPIGAKSLKDSVKSSDRVAIVISDITRPTPNHKLIPWILDEISHVPREQITIINGNGTHRDQTTDEFITMLGPEIVNNFRLINNHCSDETSLKQVGVSKFGCEVFLNKEYVEADFRIVTGFIEPHFFAGFSGGPKGVMPGVAGLDTILTFHNARMIGDPMANWGIIENNPLQEMTREVNHLCKPNFILNVTLNRQKEITEVFAGELIAAHTAGCKFVKEHSMVKCAQRFDVVITSNSGYPLDQNLYQAVKGMSAAQKIVKQGGTIICASECSDGLPNHGNYAQILKMRQTPQELLDMINDPAFRMFDQWQVQRQAMIQLWADVYVYSQLPDEQVKGAMFKPTHDIEQTLVGLTDKYGKDMSVAVLPLGPLTIPYVAREE